MPLPRRLALAAFLAAFAPAAALAHPHVFVDARLELAFDAEGRLAEVHNIWRFDAPFTAFALEGLAEPDGSYSKATLAALSDTNVDSLSYYDYFTYVSAGGRQVALQPAGEHWLEYEGGRLTLFFSLPLKEPLPMGPDTTIEVFDPEYFVAFTFDPATAVQLDFPPQGCAAAYQPPHELDAATMAYLGAIPADQHDLPPALADAAAGLANLIHVTCPAS